jgi:hypothetical protein
MACFLLRGPDGERWIEELEPYRLGAYEHIVPGVIRWDCGPNPTPPQTYRKCSSCGELGVYEST